MEARLAAVVAEAGVEADERRLVPCLDRPDREHRGNDLDGLHAVSERLAVGGPAGPNVPTCASEWPARRPKPGRTLGR